MMAPSDIRGEILTQFVVFSSRTFLKTFVLKFQLPELLPGRHSSFARDE